MARWNDYASVHRYVVRGIVTLAAGLWAFGADAQVVENPTTQSSYTFAGGAGTGDRGAIHVAGASSQLDLKYFSLVGPGGSFDFEHALDCAGACFAGVSTLLTDTITNTGPAAIALDFSSVISAGYLGFNGGGGGAYFTFDVTQDHASLYSAFGSVDASGTVFGMSDGSSLNGLTLGSGVGTLAWGDTPLTLSLGSLGAGESTILRFRLSTFVESVAGGRAALSFGDPRTGGGLPPPVPEPGTWMMMVLGFGTLGSALRRRSARQVLA